MPKFLLKNVEVDCQEAPPPPTLKPPSPPIDYLTKDYASFRQLMLDRLGVLMPDWKEKNPADFLVTLVEVLAYAADHLSYYQDAVATEAYLGTARKRISVRRLARLLDYRMHQGCNARTWICFEIEKDKTLTLKQETLLLTQCENPVVIRDGSELEEALKSGVQVFETLREIELDSSHNKILLDPEKETEPFLFVGATQARILPGQKVSLNAGDVVILEESNSGSTPCSGDDSKAVKAHAVRLLAVKNKGDKGTVIQWHEEDPLPFVMKKEDVVIRANVVPVDHGYRLPTQTLDPQEVPQAGPYRPRLACRDLTYGEPFDESWERSASALIRQDPRRALPNLELAEPDDDPGDEWKPVFDLLASGRSAKEFIVEPEEGGWNFLRFGDNVLGRKPNSSLKFQVTCRSGNGPVGNVGARTIRHVVGDFDSILCVWNPLPAQGGTSPENSREVRLYAPQAFRRQERAVTPHDYASVAERHPHVQKAIAELAWTGSRHEMLIRVDRLGGRPVDQRFKQNLRDFLNQYRLAGHGLQIQEPRFAPLDIGLKVRLKEGYLRRDVVGVLAEALGNGLKQDGAKGYFHPDRFTFGQPVYLSRIVAEAMKVPGVDWVQVDRFHRWGRFSVETRKAGLIRPGPTEIARLDNDPEFPYNGVLELLVEGGGR